MAPYSEHSRLPGIEAEHPEYSPDEKEIQAILQEHFLSLDLHRGYTVFDSEGEPQEISPDTLHEMEEGASEMSDRELQDAIQLMESSTIQSMTGDAQDSTEKLSSNDLRLAVLYHEGQRRTHLETLEGKDTVEKLRDNVWLLHKEGSMNPVTVVFRRGKELLITDPGTAIVSGGKNNDLHKLEKALGANVAGVLLTHSHPDHIGNLPNMANADIPVYAHPKAFWSLRTPKVLLRGERVLTRPDPHPSELKRRLFERLGPLLYGPGFGGMKMHGKEKEQGGYRTFPDGPIHFDGFTVDVVETPGHTRGEVCFWIPESKILVGGDLVPNSGTGRDQIPSLYMPECNVYDSLASLEKMRSLGAELFVPAHGEPIQSAKEIHRRLSDMIHLLKKTIARIQEVHTDSPKKSEIEIAKEVFADPAYPQNGMRFGMIEKKSIVHSVLRDEIRNVGETAAEGLR